MTQDKDIIKSSIQKFGAAFNGRNAKDMAALFTTEAEFINVLGMRMSGRAGIEAGYSAYFNQMSKIGSVAFTVVETKFVTADVAICLVDWKGDVLPSAGQGAPQPEKGTLTMVLTKVGSQWLLAAGQNTMAAAPPKPA